MKPVVKKASPAATAVLKQATMLWPKRKKLSDGLLPSLAHQKANPNSDHNTGLAVDLTHDPKNGVDCAKIFESLKKDKRVSYLIFDKKIWSRKQARSGNRPYSGSNPHTKHLHISINSNSANDTSDWFSWMKAKPKPVKKVVDKKPQSKYNSNKSIIGSLFKRGVKKATCTCKTCPVHKKGKK
jgi:hypothetical protein